MQSSQRSSSSRGPEAYFGYCHRSKQYRMMDLPDYVSNSQEGMSRMMKDGANAYQNAMASYAGAGYQGANGSDTAQMYKRGHRDCGCGGHGREDCGCHCECCVCDADVLIHARCGELRRIPFTFENETRRDKPVTLELGKFLSQGGKDLGWAAQLSQTSFTLRPCDENTVSLLVAIRCKTDDTPTNPNTPGTSTNVPGANPNNPASGSAAEKERAQATLNRDALSTADLSAIDARLGSVDKCEVGYATIRAEGCPTRPIIVAIAVLPEDCDSYRHPCGCGCCH